MRQKKKALLNILRQMARTTSSLGEPHTLERAFLEDQVMVKRSPEVAAAHPRTVQGAMRCRGLQHLYEDVNSVLVADFDEDEAQRAFDILKRLEINGRRWLDAQTRADSPK
jgi:hypothetical protein